jgi:hypothetical protein
MDPDFVTPSLDSKYQVERKSHEAHALPDKEQRDQLFQGIQAIDQFDQLKKDILFMDLKRKSVSELQQKYPELTRQQLKSLKETLE